MTTSGKPAPRTPRVARQPVLRVGDSWTFSTRVVGGGAPLVLTHRVLAIDTQGRLTIGVRNAASPDAPQLMQVLDRQMNRLSREFAPGEAVHYTPAFASFRFPMAPGTLWRTTVQQSQKDAGPPARIQITARAMDWKRIEVPAGTFDALRIEAHHRRGDVLVRSTYWYAPQAARAIQGHEATEGPGGPSELEYRLLSLGRVR
jgi:hypothetical protein